MINANNYETHEELEAAMKNEINIGTKRFLDENISKLEIEIVSLQGSLERMKQKSMTLNTEIDNYYKSLREKHQNDNGNSS